MSSDARTEARSLFLASSLMLFLELVLIRWLGESILYLSFFTNFVLLASFLGIGLGFLRPSQGEWFRFLPLGLGVLVAAVMAFPVEIDRSASDVIFIGTGETKGTPIWIVLPVVFAAVTAIMTMAGQRVAVHFRALPPLRAYRIDILGSLTGIAAFAAMAFLRTPPVVWSLAIGGLIIALDPGVLRRTSRIGLLSLVALMGIQTLRPGYSWSPYYRVELIQSAGPFTYINVNGIPHQATGRVEDFRQLDWIADWPYRVRRSDRPPVSVLVIGAGNGNDVAYAIDHGAQKVDAVEIDPRIFEIGVALHPERPYQDPRVTVHIDDGRAYMQNTDQMFDLVLFALPDSLTSVASQSNLRLESYLFTKEAFSRVAEILNTDGMFALYNTHRDAWVVDRMAVTMQAAFGQEVCQLGGADVRRAMLATGPGLDTSCPGGRLHDGAGPAPVSDDRPFLYIRDREIPSFYLISLGMVLTFSAVLVRRFAGSLPLRGYADLFFMGAGFLLLETKSISQFALWFGTTWHVNALVFAAVLLSVLGAIQVTKWMSRRAIVPLYALLLASVVTTWTIPPSALLSLAYPARWMAASVITFMPIFVANLVFAQRFKDSDRPTLAFGINLLGAMFGGVLEYLALVVGHRALNVGVGLLYLLALWSWWRSAGAIRSEVRAT